MSQSARSFLDAVNGYGNDEGGKKPSADRPIRLGIIDETYTSGLAKVRFDGEEVVGTKGYACISSYNPTADDRVALLPVGTSYLIIGKVDPTPRAFPEWHDLTPFLENGWNENDVPVSALQANPEYIRSSDGWVKVKGLIGGGTIGNETVVATLPEGYRPTGQLHFATISDELPAFIRVNPSGAITISDDVTTGWLSLDPISFVAER